MTFTLIAERMHHFHFGGACLCAYLVIAYKNEDFMQGNERYDAILAVNGYEPLSACAASSSHRGSMSWLVAATVRFSMTAAIPLHETADAIRNLEEGHTRGKIVITVVV